MSWYRLRSNLVYIGTALLERSSLVAELNSKKIKTLLIENEPLDLNLINDFNFVLFGATGKEQVDLVKKIVLLGKTVVVILSPNDKSIANLFIKSGASAIFVDPVQIEEVINFENIYHKNYSTKRELLWLRSQLSSSYRSLTTNGESAAAKKIKSTISKVGRKFKLIFLEGEKGIDTLAVSKELHVKFPGIKHPFCSWFPSGMNDSELGKKLIRLEMYKGEEGNILRLGGSIFIDDFSVLSAENQKRVFSAIERLGVSSEFRLILSNIIDPEKLIQEKGLHFNKNQSKNYTIKLPPLRNRRKDIPSIVNSILEDYSQQMQEKIRFLTPGALKWICSKKWWGNDSELKMLLWKSLTYSDSSVLSIDSLKSSQVEEKIGDIESFLRMKLAAVIPALSDEDGSDFYDHTIKSVEKPLIELVLKESGGNRIKAARLLGMNRNTLSKKLHLLGLAGRTSKISLRRKKRN